MFRYTITLTRENATIYFLNPDSQDNVFDFLSNAAKHNIAVVQLFSDDNLNSKIVFSAENKEQWEEYANKFVFTKEGKIDDDWYVQNNISYTIEEEFY